MDFGPVRDGPILSFRSYLIRRNIVKSVLEAVQKLEEKKRSEGYIETTYHLYIHRKRRWSRKRTTARNSTEGAMENLNLLKTIFTCHHAHHRRCRNRDPTYQPRQSPAVVPWTDRDPNQMPLKRTRPINRTCNQLCGRICNSACRELSPFLGLKLSVVNFRNFRKKESNISLIRYLICIHVPPCLSIECTNIFDFRKHQ